MTGLRRKWSTESTIEASLHYGKPLISNNLHIIEVLLSPKSMDVSQTVPEPEPTYCTLLCIWATLILSKDWREDGRRTAHIWPSRRNPQWGHTHLKCLHTSSDTIAWRSRKYGNSCRKCDRGCYLKSRGRTCGQLHYFKEESHFIRNVEDSFSRKFFRIPVLGCIRQWKEARAGLTRRCSWNWSKFWWREPWIGKSWHCFVFRRHHMF